MQIQDESGDKKYFTIIPNYILNHSTAIDQALYMQMKRIAGDGGQCSTGVRYFMRQLGIGKVAIKKSMKYLIEHKWINYLGKKKVMTEGGVQQINTYKVNDIWKHNIEHYKGVAEITPPAKQGGSKKYRRVGLKMSQGVAEMAQKKNLKKELKNSDFIPGIGRIKKFALEEN